MDSKTIYETLELKVMHFEATDVIVTSNEEDGYEGGQF